MKKEIKTYHLTSAQKSISIIEKFHPKTSYVNLGITIRIRGHLDYHLLNNAINLVIMQNDALRTRLTNDSNETVQYFAEYNELTFELLDFSYPKGLEDYHKWAQNATTTVFPLYDSNLCYFAMVKFSANESGFFIKCHHIIVDFWSIILLVNQIVENYYGLINEVGPEIKSQHSYVEHIIKEQKYLSLPRFSIDKDYWNQLIKKVPYTTLFKKKRFNNLEARRKSYSFPMDISSKINELCFEYKISPFILFCSALSIYFWKKEGREQIVIGTTVLNRATLKDKNTIGAYFNNLPFIIQVNPSLSFKNYLNYLHMEWLRMLRYSSYPYVNILKEYREIHKAKNELLDFTLTFLNASLDKTKIEFDLDSHFNGQEVNTLRININDMESKGLFYLDYDYSIEVLNEDKIQEINQSIMNLIQDGIKNPDQIIVKLNMLSTEQQQILDKFNQTEMEFLPENTFIHMFQEKVNRIPEHIALVFEDNKLTYKEVNDKSNQLARFLLKKGVAKEEIVGFSVERSFDLVIGILGILKAGAAYLPIDPNYPSERIAHMLRDSACHFLLTNCGLKNDLRETKVEFIDLRTPEIWEGSADNLVCSSRPTDLAYVIYTSGSTGLPKGVMIEHKAISNFFHAIIQEIDFSYQTIISLTTLSFDIFFIETLVPLLIGMKVIIANNQELATPALLSDLIVRYQVDVIQATPSRMNAMLNNNSTCLRNLSLIMVGGEVFPESLLLSLKNITNAKIYNMYGPTETTIWSSTKRLDNTNQLTIGKPIGNTKFFILDKYQMPVPIGFSGELFIAGYGLSQGYLNRPELTEERFVPNPFVPGTRMYQTGDIGKWLKNGEVEYIGRNDDQVKIRGFRIELGEIEKCLLKNERIQQAVVTSKTGNLDRAYLCAFLVGSEELSLSELRQHLSDYLPDHMIPNRFIWLPDFPLTPNGKVDRRSLPDPAWIEEGSPHKYVLPRDVIEQKLAEIWSEVLEIPNVGIDDDFFGLGGDSLAILEILSSTLPNDWKISAQEFYEYPTIRKLSSMIKERCFITNQPKNAYLNNCNLPSNFDVLNRYTTQAAVDSGNVLLTGVTGFLGIHILMELLNHHPGNVYCLVRGHGFEKRFENLFYFYFPRAASNLIRDRIILINGDISKQSLGLSEDEYQRLAGNVASVIHSAAMVRHFGIYSEFESVNVKGTQEIVDFCQKHNKHLSFISTISVSGNYMSEETSTKDFTENDLYIGQDYQRNVYVRSKFEAESLILEAVKNDLKATIFRVGILTGRISDGQFQHNIEENAFYRKLKSIFEIMHLPESVLKEFLEFTPVDSCAKAIISILKSSSPKPLIFHLLNHKTLRIENLLNILGAYGISIKGVTSKEFTDVIISLSQSEKGKEIMSGIVTDIIMKGNLTFTPAFEVDSLNTVNYLKSVGFEWPDLTEEYVGKIIGNMIKVGFLQESKLIVESNF